MGPSRDKKFNTERLLTKRKPNPLEVIDQLQYLLATEIVMLSIQHVCLSKAGWKATREVGSGH